MNTFGNIKTKLENVATALYGKPTFKPFMQTFKKVVLENKDLSEIYFIYDDLSENKGLDKDIAEEYINESLEYCQILIESNTSKIQHLDAWLSNYVKSQKNNYSHIDNAVYLKSIKNLETVLESKKQIKTTLTSERKKESVIKENINLPISTMLGIANKKLSQEVSSLNENDKKELNDIISLSFEETKNEISELKENIVSKLKSKINESNDVELKTTINDTITKIMETKSGHYDLYKLRKLNSGL